MQASGQEARARFESEAAHTEHEAHVETARMEAALAEWLMVEGALTPL
jgi:hypothetical protein